MSEVVPGLCSVTLRHLTTDAVIELAAQAGLRAIEWGADVHLPPTTGQAEARALARRCSDAGLSCPSYGTYWFAGRNDDAELDAIFDTAEALGASLLRVWTPFGIGPGAPESERSRVAACLQACAERATHRHLAVALEFHPGTLTETAASTLDLLARCSDVLTYWQPRPGDGEVDAIPELEAVADHLAHLHVFSWDPGYSDRRALDHHEGLWRRALRIAASKPSSASSRCAYLEFVRDDSVEALLEDALELVRYIEEETR